jgi:hypothetical protein
MSESQSNIYAAIWKQQRRQKNRQILNSNRRKKVESFVVENLR